ncbi:xanthine dehydrogenase small subunit [Xylophilus sp. GOD-11R]|uniref:xanthine dehydrogenase small subunit n=1 Tax=Xylophilus sp. GOD-11R TaxID=3089814 RepID=UPI00298D5B25|nr:xanthine dehydrogenase small subunit [Xylophilus sp. GOD-11R]WPB55718.1 xanthine dehydrogenase small subunit [Xylophilus sp. GOD-11R]
MTTTRPLTFIRRGKRVTLHDVAPDRTLLDLLREDLHHTGTKEGCGEGDCGACTVVLGERATDTNGQPAITYRAINSCIRLAHSIDGMALWTVEDLATDPLIRPAGGDAAPPPGCLHPAQESMVACHGSQCGFCTPGFVMSLFGMYQNRVVPGQSISRAQAQEDLSGNLCRCTGYRPIFDAAQRMETLPRVAVDEAALLSQLGALAHPPQGTEGYQAPATLASLLQARAERPHAQIVAGCTDVGLWITKQHRQFAQVLDVTRAAELRRVEPLPGGGLRIGAAVNLQDAYAALCATRPQLQNFAARFAGLPVRNSGTLGGNVANGSPIGDSMPLLIALDAQVVLASVRGQRALPLESLYTGYRQNVIAADEIVAFIDVPPAADDEFLRAYKVSKRQDDDISAVCLAIRLVLRDGVVAHASIGAGGVAATPARARDAEATLVGRPWSAEAATAAGAALQAEFSPISDMRASSAYRSVLLGNLLQRFWRESQGQAGASLASIDIVELTA